MRFLPALPALQPKSEKTVSPAPKRPERRPTEMVRSLLILAGQTVRWGTVK
jgi:hypothetical protein